MSDPAVNEAPQSDLRSARTDRRQNLTTTPVMERRLNQRRKPAVVLDEAFDEFHSVAFGVALRVTGNRQEADDVTHGLFLALWQHPEGDPPPADQASSHRSIRVRLADALMGVPSPAQPGGGEANDNSLALPRQSYEFAGWLPRDGSALRLAPADRRNPTVTVVIPTLNEADNLPHVFERLPTWIDEVIVVDGNSTDDTVAVARRCRPDVRIVSQDGKGKGNALACGFKAASSDITVMLDADGSTDPAEIPRFVAALTNGFDFAKGTRFVTGGGSDDITPVRRLGNWVITSLVNRIWGSRYSDLCYGYNAFWTHALPPSFSDCNGFEVETLMNIRLAASDVRVVEVPSFEANRRYGTSNLKAGRDGARVLRTILAEWVRPN